jgi:multidrug efflux pump
VIVVLLFLQDWKALLLPVIDVAVSLVGTFAVMRLMGFYLNNLTLFGLVLAIGIVVLENIERWLAKGLPVREATIRAMHEITGPILAITLVLSSVLLPGAFLGGITGQFFRQFALTISASMLISAANATTLTPVFYSVVRRLSDRGRSGPRPRAGTGPTRPQPDQSGIPRPPRREAIRSTAWAATAERADKIKGCPG